MTARAEEPLDRLLGEVHDGGIQVAEFQRELVLEDDWIVSLLASVSQDYPIGAVTFLEAGSPDLRFDVRPLPGAPAATTKPERLLLDGQHRLAALYQVLVSGDRAYCVDIKSAVDANADRDEVIFSVSDAGPSENEWDRCVYPLRLVFGADDEAVSWKRGFVGHGADVAARERLMLRFEAEVIDAFTGYRIPTTTVGKGRTRWAVRVHGGKDGRSLSDRYRVSDP